MLLATRMVCVACPGCRGNINAVTLPLPDPPSDEFLALPEHLVEDMMDVLLYMSRRPTGPDVSAALSMPAL